MKQSLSQYMKHYQLENKNPVSVIINDKIRVKEYIDERIPGNDLFAHRLYAGYSVEQTIAAIEKPCVVRLNNGWHKMKILLNCDDNISYELLKTWQETNWKGTEWAYRQIKPGFTVERILPLKHNLFKLFIFHGKVHYVWQQQYDIISRKVGKLQFATMYDKNWKKINTQWNKNPMPDCHKPLRLNDMIEIAEKLYHPDFKFMRVDLYCNDDRIRFSEMMDLHAGGTNGFSGDFDYVLGALL